MPWWKQRLLRQVRILVVGAGTLGNEILKNLALLGAGRILVVDCDRVERSNLSRSVLFREKDCGRPKANLAARRLAAFYPDIRTRAIEGNIVTDVGLGVFRWADIVFSAVDNREARVWINEACARFRKPWLDGGIEALEGVVRFFFPADGPCYECTMSESDWALLKQRKSCSLMTLADVEKGKIPTTPTTASVIAGVMCQEAVKYLHGLETLVGKGFVFNGLTHDSYVVEYSRKPGCYGHDVAPKIKEVRVPSSRLRLVDLLRRAQGDLGPRAVFELNNEILSHFICKTCKRNREVFIPLNRVKEEELRCSTCGKEMTIETFHSVTGEEPFLTKTVRQIGVPPFDVIGARLGMKQIFYEISADAPLVLGSLLEK